MTLRALLLAGSAALIAVPASALSDFRLPGTSTPTPTPPVVGPADPDRPAPRPAPTPTPTPRPTLTPSPTPPSTSAPVITLPPVGQATQARPTARPTRTAAPASGATPTAAPDAAGTAPPLAGETPFALPTFAPAPSASPAVAPTEEDGGLPWPWIAGFGLLVALLAAGWWWLRRRMLPGGTVLLVPEIEKPRVPEPAPEPEHTVEPAIEPALAAAPAEAARPAHPLQITIQPLKLTQTVMNASLSYMLSLTNQGEAPLESVTVAADLVAAHASLPREALMAAPDTELPLLHEVPSLAPGETVNLKGELRLPLARAMPIRQGAAVVFVPLARFRASAAGAEPRCFTLVVGQPSPRGAIEPHRLDLGPRSAEGLTGHAF